MYINGITTLQKKQKTLSIINTLKYEYLFILEGKSDDILHFSLKKSRFVIKNTEYQQPISGDHCNPQNIKMIMLLSNNF